MNCYDCDRQGQTNPSLPHVKTAEPAYMKVDTRSVFDGIRPEPAELAAAALAVWILKNIE